MHSLCSGCFVYFCLSTCFKILLTASTPFLSRGAAFPVFFQQTLRLGPALQWCHFGSPQVRPQPQENGKDYIGIYVFLLNKEKKLTEGHKLDLSVWAYHAWHETCLPNFFPIRITVFLIWHPGFSSEELGKYGISATIMVTQRSGPSKVTILNSDCPFAFHTWSQRLAWAPED